MNDTIMYNRTDCRLCKSDQLHLALPINDSPIGDAYITKDELSINQPSYPLSLYLCKACGHLQLPCVIDPKFLFSNYIYRTATSHGLVEHFRLYADDVKYRLGGKSNGLAVEIGSNDGSLLKFFQQQGMRVLGVDPASEIAAEASAAGVETLPTFFTYELAQEIKNRYGAADVIAANNVFAHVDDMEDLVKGIQHLLAPEGIFIFEASYLVDMIDKNVFDTIYHEHLCYHRIQPLETFFNRHGMTLFDIKRINTKGGSLRGFVKLISSKREIEPVVQEMMQLEKSMKLDKLETYHDFSAHLDKIKLDLHSVLNELKANGKTIVGYGASPSVTTTTYHFEVGPYLDYIVDDNPIKQGRYSPGHHLPVVSSQMIYDKKPDYILILAWQYADVIMKKNQQFLAEGGHFIIPLPTVEIK